MSTEDDDDDSIEIISTHDEKAKIVGEILSNDTSRKILNLLSGNNEKTLNQIAQETGLSLSLVTHHIKRMQSVQIVQVTKIGRSVKGQKMNYYSATNQSFLITPSKEPTNSIRSSLKKFSRFAAIGMAGIVSWMTLNSGEEFSEQASPGAPQFVLEDQSGDKWDAAYQEKENVVESKAISDRFDSGEEQAMEHSKQTDMAVSSESVVRDESAPSHSGVVSSELSDEGEFKVVLEEPEISSDENFDQEVVYSDYTDLGPTGSLSQDSDVYLASGPSEFSYATDGDGIFLSIIIPIAVVVAGIVFERVLNRWYRKRSMKVNEN